MHEQRNVDLKLQEDYCPLVKFYGPRNVQDFSFNMLRLVYMLTHYKNVIDIQAVFN